MHYIRSHDRYNMARIEKMEQMYLYEEYFVELFNLIPLLG